MIFCALVLLGVVALRKLPVQLMPAGFDPAFMMVRVPYPGANPTEVEEEIVLPLENALYTVRGIQEVNCRASNDSARCWVEFSNFVDMEETYNIVADRVERLRATEWPDDIERVYLRRFNPDNDPTMHVGVVLPSGPRRPVLGAAAPGGATARAGGRRGPGRSGGRAGKADLHRARPGPDADPPRIAVAAIPVAAPGQLRPGIRRPARRRAQAAGPLGGPFREPGADREPPRPRRWASPETTLPACATTCRRWSGSAASTAATRRCWRSSRRARRTRWR